MSKKNKAKDQEVLTDEQPKQQNEVSENKEEQAPSAEELLAVEKDKFLRLFAEYENYKKRTSKERIELFKTAGQEVILALLPVLDDFDRAINELKKSSDENALKGVELIYNKFKNTLNQKGLQEVEVSQGDTFDGEVHEAVTQIAAPNDQLKGKIIDVIEKGYALSEKIIRYPKVVVGQ